MLTKKIVFGALASGATLLGAGLTKTASADTYAYTPGYGPTPVYVPSPTYVPAPTYVPYPTYVPAPVYPQPVYVAPSYPLFDFSFGFGGGHWHDHDWDHGHGGWHDGGHHR